MRKRIFYSIVILMLLTATFSCSLILRQTYDLYLNDTKQNIISIATLILNEDGNDCAYFVKKYERAYKSLKVAFIYSNPSTPEDGDYSFDSLLTSTSPEVKQAWQEGSGFNIRKDSSHITEYLFYSQHYSEGIVLRLAYPIDEFAGISENILAAVIGGVILIILCAAFISYLISKRLVQPILELSNVISKVSDGDYSARASTDTYSEIKHLAQNFNNMTSSLKQNISLLQQHSERINQIIRNMNEGFIAIDKNSNIELINNRALEYLKYKGQDAVGKNLLFISRNTKLSKCVDEVLKSNQPVIVDIESNRRDIRVFASPVEQGGLVLFLQNITKIKQIEKMRSEFTANVSHELKTPLTSIRGFAETLKEGAIDDKATALTFLDIISEESDRLYKLISDILQLSEIEAMKKDAVTEKFDISTILAQVSSMLQPSADKIGVNIILDYESILVNANPDRIKQLFLNLIENAINYNKEGGEVFCSVKNKDNLAILSIKDTGIGISENDLPRIFERFYRTDKSRSKKVGGTGLGLSVVKHIVHLYGGTIEVQSNLGVGTEFIVKLPII